VSARLFFFFILILPSLEKVILYTRRGLARILSVSPPAAQQAQYPPRFSRWRSLLFHLQFSDSMSHERAQGPVFEMIFSFFPPGPGRDFLLRSRSVSSSGFFWKAVGLYKDVNPPHLPRLFVFFPFSHHPPSPVVTGLFGIFTSLIDRGFPNE